MSGGFTHRRVDLRDPNLLGLIVTVYAVTYAKSDKEAERRVHHDKDISSLVLVLADGRELEIDAHGWEVEGVTINASEAV